MSYQVVDQHELQWLSNIWICCETCGEGAGENMFACRNCAQVYYCSAECAPTVQSRDDGEAHLYICDELKLQALLVSEKISWEQFCAGRKDDSEGLLSAPLIDARSCEIAYQDIEIRGGGFRGFGGPRLGVPGGVPRGGGRILAPPGRAMLGPRPVFTPGFVLRPGVAPHFAMSRPLVTLPTRAVMRPVVRSAVAWNSPLRRWGWWGTSLFFPLWFWYFWAVPPLLALALVPWSLPWLTYYAYYLPFWDYQGGRWSRRPRPEYQYMQFASDDPTRSHQLSEPPSTLPNTPQPDYAPSQLPGV